MAANYDHTETIAAYTGPDGALYEVDHLGICFPEQAGTYAVYRDGEMVADFVPSLIEVVLPEALTPAELIELAQGAVEGDG